MTHRVSGRSRAASYLTRVNIVVYLDRYLRMYCLCEPVKCTAIYTVYILYIYCIYTVYILYIYTVYALYIYCIHAVYISFFCRYVY